MQTLTKWRGRPGTAGVAGRTCVELHIYVVPHQLRPARPNARPRAGGLCVSLALMFAQMLALALPLVASRGCQNKPAQPPARTGGRFANNPPFLHTTPTRKISTSPRFANNDSANIRWAAQCRNKHPQAPPSKPPCTSIIIPHTPTTPTSLPMQGTIVNAGRLSVQPWYWCNTTR